MAGARLLFDEQSFSFGDRDAARKRTDQICAAECVKCLDLPPSSPHKNPFQTDCVGNWAHHEGGGTIVAQISGMRMNL
jgi:hypothetical protein